MAATVALLLAVFCIGIDMYVVAALIPTLADDLSEPVAAMGLMVSAYALPTALLTPLFGPLSDRHGRRLAKLGGMTFFAATVAGTAWAPTLPILVPLRVLNGLGAAVMLPAAFGYAGDLPTAAQRSRAMGNLALGFPLAALPGAPVRRVPGRHLRLAEDVPRGSPFWRPSGPYSSGACPPTDRGPRRSSATGRACAWLSATAPCSLSSS